MGEKVEVTPGQPLRALERANEVRLARAELKRQVATGARSAAEVIESCPWHAESMAVSDLLMSQRRWGRARCRRVLLTLELSENKPIADLTERQRGALAAVLSGGAPPRRRRERQRERAGIGAERSPAPA